MSVAQIIAMAGSLEFIQAAAPAEGEAPKLPRFKIDGYNGGPIKQPWSDVPLIVDLEGMDISAQAIPVFLNHDRVNAVGHTESIAIKGKKLTAEGVVSRTTPAAADVVASGRNGYPWQASIQAPIMGREFVEAGKKAQVNGKSWAGPLMIARKTKLIELSFVDLGADATTSASIAASAAATHEESAMELKTRKAALLAKHPQHEPLILAALCDGKEDPEILAEIEAATVKAAREADAAKLTEANAKVEAAAAEIASVKAELAKRDEAIAAKDAEIAALKAKLGVPPIKAGAGDEQAAKRRREMSDSDRMAFIKAHGADAYAALPY